MKPPDEAQPTDYPERHDGQIRFAGERLPKRQHDKRYGDYAEHEENDFDPIQSPRRWRRL